MIKSLQGQVKGSKMQITVLEDAQVTHCLTYELDVASLEEGIKEINSGTVDYQKREWVTEDAHYLDQDSFHATEVCDTCTYWKEDLNGMYCYLTREDKKFGETCEKWKVKK